MKRSNLPDKDSEFDAFQQNFIAQITANAMAWNINPTLLALLTGLQALWTAAYAVARIRVTRSAASVAAKNQARSNYKSALRLFIKGSIFANTAMNDADIELCGLRPYDRTRSPIPVPTQQPIVNVQRAPGNFFTVRFFRLDDETGAIHRGKPDKVAKIEFAYSLGTQPANPDAAAEHKTATRGPIRVEVPLNMQGQTVWYYARWKNLYDAGGPWTEVASFVL